MITHLTRFAADPTAQVNSDGNVWDTGLPTITAGNSQLQSVMQIVFGVLAALAVMVIVIGALRLVGSNGNPEGVKNARATIVYAVLGLLICISAELIVAYGLKFIQ